MITNTVLVFKTSVTRPQQVRQLRPLLNALVDGRGHWNFDLEDCDNILRIETQPLPTTAITSMLRARGFSCEEL